MKRLRSFGFVLIAGVLVLAGCGDAAGPPAQDMPAPTVQTPAVAVTIVHPTATPAVVSAPVPEAAVSVVFDSATVDVGDTVVAHVSVDGVADLYGVELHLAYPGDLLDVVDADAEVEGVQIENGDLLAVEMILQNQCSAALGVIDYAATQLLPAKGVSGGGEIAQIRLEATAAGTAEVRILSVVLANAGGKEIPVALPVEASVLTVK